MSETPAEKPFQINLGALKKQDKTAEPARLQAAEDAGAGLGYVSREAAPRKRGRKPSPRTGQVHAKVFPDIAEEIANEARRRGVQQGVLIEEAWALYKNKSGN